MQTADVCRRYNGVPGIGWGDDVEIPSPRHLAAVVRAALLPAEVAGAAAGGRHQTMFDALHGQLRRRRRRRRRRRGGGGGRGGGKPLGGDGGGGPNEEAERRAVYSHDTFTTRGAPERISSVVLSFTASEKHTWLTSQN